MLGFGLIILGPASLLFVVEDFLRDVSLISVMPESSSFACAPVYVGVSRSAVAFLLQHECSGF
jgi:hypothetical protein